MNESNPVVMEIHVHKDGNATVFEPGGEKIVKPVDGPIDFEGHEIKAVLVKKNPSCFMVGGRVY